MSKSPIATRAKNEIAKYESRCLSHALREMEPISGDDAKELFQAFDEKNFVRVSELIISKPWLVNARNMRDETPLYCSCKLGWTSVVHITLLNGANINAKKELFLGGTSTPLEVAVIYGHFATVNLLIAYAADWNLTESNGSSNALGLSALKGNADIFNLLLKSGAKLCIGSGQYGFAMLHAAAVGGSLIIVEYLVNEGFDVNAGFDEQSDRGWSPLHTAAFHGQLEVIKYLVARGAMINLRDPGIKSLTPMGVAIEMQKTEIVNYFRSIGGIE